MESPLRTSSEKTAAVSSRHAPSVRKGEEKEEAQSLARRLLNGTLADDGSSSTLGVMEESQVFELGSFADSPHAAAAAGGSPGGGGGDGRGDPSAKSLRRVGTLSTADSWAAVERSRALAEQHRKTADRAFARLRDSLALSGFPVDENMQHLIDGTKAIDLERFLAESRRRNQSHAKPVYTSNLDLHERNALFESDADQIEVAELLSPDVDIEAAVKELGQRLGLVSPDGGWKPRCGCDVKLDLIKQQCKADERRITRARFLTAFTREVDRNVAVIDEFLSRATEAEEVRMRELTEVRERQYAMISRMQQQKQLIERLRKRMRDAGLRLEDESSIERVDTMDFAAVQGYRSFAEQERQRSRCADIPRKTHRLVKRRILQFCAHTEQALMASFDHDSYVDPYLEEYLEKVRSQRRSIARGSQTLTDEELLVEHGIFVPGAAGAGGRSAVLEGLVRNTPLPSAPPAAFSAGLNSLQLPQPPTEEQRAANGDAAKLLERLRDEGAEAIHTGSRVEKALHRLSETTMESVGRLEGLRARVMGGVAAVAGTGSATERDCAPLFTFANNGARDAIDAVIAEVRAQSKVIMLCTKDLVAERLRDLNARASAALPPNALHQQEGQNGAKTFSTHVEDVRESKREQQAKQQDLAASRDGNDSRRKPPSKKQSTAAVKPKKMSGKGEKAAETKSGYSSPGPKKPMPTEAAALPPQTSDCTAGEPEDRPVVDGGGAPRGTAAEELLAASQVAALQRAVTQIRDCIVKGTRLLLANERLSPVREFSESAAALDSGHAGLPRLPHLLDDLAAASEWPRIVELVKGWKEAFLPAVGARMPLDPEAPLQLASAARGVRRSTETLVAACTRVGFTFPVEFIVAMERPLDAASSASMSGAVEVLRQCEAHLGTIATRVRKQFSALVAEEQLPVVEQMRRASDAAHSIMAALRDAFPEMVVEQPLQALFDAVGMRRFDELAKHSAAGGDAWSGDAEPFDCTQLREEVRIVAEASASAVESLHELMRNFANRQEEEVQRRAQRTVTEMQARTVDVADKQALREVQRAQRVRNEVEARIREENERLRSAVAAEEARLEKIRLDNERRVREMEEQTQRSIKLQEELKTLRTKQARDETDEAIEREELRLAEVQASLLEEMLASLSTSESENRSGITALEQSQLGSLKELELAVRRSLEERHIVFSGDLSISLSASFSPAAASLSPRAASKCPVVPVGTTVRSAAGDAVPRHSETGFAVDEHLPLQQPRNADARRSLPSSEAPATPPRWVSAVLSSTSTSASSASTSPTQGASWSSESFRSVDVIAELLPGFASRGTQVDLRLPTRSRKCQANAAVAHTRSAETQLGVSPRRETPNDQSSDAPSPSAAPVLAAAPPPPPAEEGPQPPPPPPLQVACPGGAANSNDGSPRRLGASPLLISCQEEGSPPCVVDLPREAGADSAHSDVHSPTATSPRPEATTDLARGVHEAFMRDFGGAIANWQRHAATETERIPPTMRLQTLIFSLPPSRGGDRSVDCVSTGLPLQTPGPSSAVEAQAFEVSDSAATPPGIAPFPQAPSIALSVRSLASTSPAEDGGSSAHHPDDAAAPARARAPPSQALASQVLQCLRANLPVPCEALETGRGDESRTSREENEQLAAVIAQQQMRERIALDHLRVLSATFREGAGKGGHPPQTTQLDAPLWHSEVREMASALRNPSVLPSAAPGGSPTSPGNLHLTQSGTASAVAVTEGAGATTAAAAAAAVLPEGSGGAFHHLSVDERMKLPVSEAATNAGDAVASQATTAFGMRARQQKEESMRVSRGVQVTEAPLLTHSEALPIATVHLNAAAATREVQRSSGLHRPPRAATSLGFAPARDPEGMSSERPSAATTPAADCVAPAHHVNVPGPSHVNVKSLPNTSTGGIGPDVRSSLALHRLLMSTLRELVKRVHRSEGGAAPSGVSGLMKTFFSGFYDPFTHTSGDSPSISASAIVAFDTDVLSRVDEHLRSDSLLAQKRIALNLEQVALTSRLRRIQSHRRNREFSVADAEVPQVAAFLDRQEQKLKKAIEAFSTLKEKIAREKQHEQQFFLPMSDVVEVPQLPHMFERRRLAGARAHIRTPVESTYAARCGPVQVKDFEHHQHPANDKRVRHNAVAPLPMTLCPPLELGAAPGLVDVLTFHPLQRDSDGGGGGNPENVCEEKSADVIVHTAAASHRQLPPIGSNPLQAVRAPPAKHVVIPRRTTQVQPDRDFFFSFLHGHAAPLAARGGSPPRFPHHGGHPRRNKRLLS